MNRQLLQNVHGVVFIVLGIINEVYRCNVVCMLVIVVPVKGDCTYSPFLRQSLPH